MSRRGKYYIGAGNVNVPTYYPGTLDVKEGRVVAVAAGATVSGIDFPIDKEKAARAPAPIGVIFSFAFSGPPPLFIPIHIQMDGGGPLPVSGTKGFSTISLSPSGGGTPIIIDITRASP
jgi:hypothetical protein